MSPPDPAQRWTAELEWHPEDGEPRFHVIARPSGGGPETRIASSKPLEWPPPDAVAVQRLRRTVAHMEAAMRRVGWTPLPPGAAWYSKRFAWTPVAEPVREAVRARDPEPAHEAVRARDPEPPASAAMRLFEPQPAWPPGTEDLWRCEIRWRAGYVNSRFTLVARRPGRRRTTTISSSQTFKWLIMEDPDPPSPEFRGAVEHLDEQIRAAGWEPAGRGRHWWDLRYVWRGDGPPPLELDPEPASMRDARGEDDEP